jgi:HEAT repeats
MKATPALAARFCAALYCAALLAPGCSRPQASDGSSQSAMPPPPAGPAAAAVPPGDGLRGQLVSLFGGYEHIVTREELVRLAGPPALSAALSAIYDDAAQPLHVRVQALASLRFFPGAQSKATFERVLMAQDTPDAARRAGAKAYGFGFQAEAVPILDKLLDHGELHTRNAAARSLGDIKDDRAQQALRRRLTQEPEPLVRKTIESGLRR